jgi:phosphomethylpyrimidine synthase
MCGPKFCSMRISQDVRDRFGNPTGGTQGARAEGMAAKSREFLELGASVYVAP